MIRRQVPSGVTLIDAVMVPCTWWRAAVTVPIAAAQATAITACLRVTSRPRHQVHPTPRRLSWYGWDRGGYVCISQREPPSCLSRYVIRKVAYGLSSANCVPGYPDGSRWT